MLLMILLALLLAGCGTNIIGGPALLSNFKWIPPNEADFSLVKYQIYTHSMGLKMDTQIYVCANFL